MTIKELQSKSVQELEQLLADKREALRAMRFKVAQRQLKKVHEIKLARRAIAQILTLIRQKEASSASTVKKSN